MRFLGDLLSMTSRLNINSSKSYVCRNNQTSQERVHLVSSRTNATRKNPAKSFRSNQGKQYLEANMEKLVTIY